MPPSAQGTVTTLLLYLGRPHRSAGDPLGEDALIRISRVLAGFAIGTVSGVLLSAVLYAVRPIRHLVDPIIELSHPLPPLAFIPLLIVWFGTDDPKIVVIAVGVLPVIVVSTVSELRNVADELELGVHVGRAGVCTLARTGPCRDARNRVQDAGLPAGAWRSVAAEMTAATSGPG